VTSEPVNTERMGALLGVTARTVTELARKGVIPRAGRGRWDPGEVVPAYCRHLREQAAGRGDGLGLDLTAERAKLARAQTARAELEMARIRGELVDAQAVGLKYTAMVSAAKSKLLAVPSKAKGRLHHLTVADIEYLEGLVTEALEELANGSDK